MQSYHSLIKCSQTAHLSQPLQQLPLMDPLSIAASLGTGCPQVPRLQALQVFLRPPPDLKRLQISQTPSTLQPVAPSLFCLPVTPSKAQPQMACPPPLSFLSPSLFLHPSPKVLFHTNSPVTRKPTVSTHFRPPSPSPKSHDRCLSTLLLGMFTRAEEHH